jgi:hypothetical protein
LFIYASLYLARRSFNHFISSFKIEILPEESSLITALFFINFALCANFNVESVSPNETALGETLAIITVFELPPRESHNKNVSFESQ